ncbi:M20 family metallopeptidase [Actinokineospora enzanensis]|uniref:M20 family metallopeptidase n=1 Tax=Actinokineospora enzanensis TaxID=155975 RepID=UPI000525C677|nr:M20/M25/M40 family metallo-hydrolase [Actinokineospora enzanensis]
MDVDEFVAAAEDLLAIRSTADRPRELVRALEFVLDAVGPGYTIERFEAGGKPSALVYRGDARPHFRVILNGHLDVVPGTDDQFRPRRAGDRLHARGAQDMKLSALAQAMAFRDATPAAPVGLQLVTDEEVGGHHGTRHQLAHGVTADFVVVGEHSALRLVTESKGLLTARVTAHGRTAHSAYQWLGDNAIHTLTRAIDAILAAYPVATEVAWRTTVTVARLVTGDTALNQVPAEATAWLDIRFPSEDKDFTDRTPDEVAEHLTALCPDKTTVHVDRVEPPHHADPDSPDVHTLRAAAQAEGYSGALLRKYGAADSRFYSARGIDAVIFGIGGDGQHGPDEYADLTTIAPYYRALMRYLAAR